MEGWYIAKVKPQKEGSLTSFLGQWGIEVFYPKIAMPGQHSVRKALFPNYVFCRLDPQSGVWRVGTGGLCLPASTGFARAQRALLDSTRWIRAWAT